MNADRTAAIIGTLIAIAVIFGAVVFISKALGWI